MKRQTLRQWRRSQQWTQKQLADRLGVTMWTVLRWERKQNGISPLGKKSLHALGFFHTDEYRGRQGYQGQRGLRDWQASEK